MPYVKIRMASQNYFLGNQLTAYSPGNLFSMLLTFHSWLSPSLPWNGPQGELWWSRVQVWALFLKHFLKSDMRTVSWKCETHSLCFDLQTVLRPTPAMEIGSQEPLVLSQEVCVLSKIIPSKYVSLRIQPPFPCLVSWDKPAGARLTWLTRTLSTAHHLLASWQGLYIKQPI